jgi:hypothetical protein
LPGIATLGYSRIGQISVAACDPDVMDTASPLPLRLTLHPLLPLRAPEPGESTLTFGFQTRLADGPGLATDDPLLQAFGAKVLPVQTSSEDRETLQDEAFDPGRRLTLAQQGVDDDGDALVAVWDAEGLRRAGFVPYPASAAVAAGLDHGLAMEAIVLTEERALLDDRRLTVEVLVCARQVVRVDHEVPSAELARPRRRRRARVVLLADGSSELRWWDPTGAAGPMAIGELPLSAELARELQRLSSAYKRAAAAGEEPPEDLVDGIERDYTRATLDARTRELWHRARRELGQRYAIGLLAPGMARPAWSAEEVEDDDGDDIPF